MLEVQVTSAEFDRDFGSVRTPKSQREITIHLIEAAEF